MNDKLKAMFPEHKHGERIYFDMEKAQRIRKEIYALELKILAVVLMIFKKEQHKYFIDCSECYKLMIQFYRDIANLYEELADIKVDKPKNVV
jgi:hypothetical protein